MVGRTQVAGVKGNTLRLVPTGLTHLVGIVRWLMDRYNNIVAVVKAKGGYLKNLKYKTYFDLFNPCLVTGSIRVIS